MSYAHCFNRGPLESTLTTIGRELAKLIDRYEYGKTPIEELRADKRKLQRWAAKVNIEWADVVQYAKDNPW